MGKMNVALLVTLAVDYLVSDELRWPYGHIFRIETKACSKHVYLT